MSGSKSNHRHAEPKLGADESHILAPGATQSTHRAHLTELCDNSALENTPGELSGAAYKSEPIAIRTFPQALLYRTMGVVRDQYGQFVRETTRGLEIMNPDWRNQDIAQEYVSEPDAVLEGDYLYTSAGNYGVYAHFLFETACTVFLMRSSIASRKICLALPWTGQVWSDPILDLLDVPRTARLRISKGCLRLANLTVSNTCSGLNTFYPNPVMKEVAQFLIAKTKATRSAKKNRIYLTRRGFDNTSNREYKHDQALSKLLEPLGFTTVNPGRLSFADQVQIFYNAEIVVGAHGSAFANLMFTPRDCLVIDLVPSAIATRSAFMTTNLTNLFEHRYIYIAGKTYRSQAGMLMDLDPSIVLSTLKKALG